MSITQLPAWQALVAHQRDMRSVHMRQLFSEDAQRFDCFSLALGDLLVDYSKNRITQETMRLLFELAVQAGLPDAIQAMFSGQRINTTEDRPALHVALRNRSNRPIVVDGADDALGQRRAGQDAASRRPSETASGEGIPANP